LGLKVKPRKYSNKMQIAKTMGKASNSFGNGLAGVI
jgi:hypothetical protein